MTFDFHNLYLRAIFKTLSPAKPRTPVADRPKDVLASVATRRDVVQRTGKFQSQWPGHDRKGSFEEA